jgi:hypothetical protein
MEYAACIVELQYIKYFSRKPSWQEVAWEVLAVDERHDTQIGKREVGGRDRD